MFVWLMVVLKIPIAALLYLVWWASKAPEAQDPEPARVIDPRSLHNPDPRAPRRPRPPRRGPHAEPPPRTPSRVRAHGLATSRPQHVR